MKRYKLSDDGISVTFFESGIDINDARKGMDDNVFLLYEHASKLALLISGVLP